MCLPPPGELQGTFLRSSHVQRGTQRVSRGVSVDGDHRVPIFAIGHLVFPMGAGVPVTSFRIGVLARADVQPASGQAVSLTKRRGMIFRALSRVNALFILYHTHTTDGRGLAVLGRALSNHD